MKSITKGKYDVLHFKADYDENWNSFARSVGMEFKKKLKLWEYKLDSDTAESVISKSLKFDFTIDEDAFLLFSKFLEGIDKKNVPISKRFKDILRNYQIEGVEFMIEKRKCINGCDMGLGKTLQAIVATDSISEYPCLIVCPASLKYNWKNELAKFIPNKTSKVFTSGDEFIVDTDYFIINFDIVYKYRKEILNSEFKVLIIDESTFVKNKKSQRSKACLQFSKRIANVFLLSGTVIENSPSELISQLEIINKMHIFGGWLSFVNRYCDMKRTPFGMDISGNSNLGELNFKMKKHFYFRRSKKEVLSELPSKTITENYVEIDMKGYQKIEDNLFDIILDKKLNNSDFDKLKEEYEQIGKSEDDAIKRKIMEVFISINLAEHLILFNELRQYTSIQKIKPLLNRIQEINKNDPNTNVLVFTNFTEPLRIMAKEMNSKFIDGSIKSEKRQLIVDEFNSQVGKTLFLNIKAGSVGLNITSASHVLFLDEPYNPSLYMQAIDRAHRMGQKRNVFASSFLALNTIDEYIHERVMINKNKIVQKVIN